MENEVEDEKKDNQEEEKKEEEKKEEEKKEEEKKEEEIIITDEKIGTGTFGVYYKAKDANDENKLYAAKEIDNKKESLVTLEKEISIYKDLQNENLVKLVKELKKDGKIYLIFEYCNGGNLSENYDRFFKKFGSPFSERILQKILKDIFKGLYYLHRNNIVHNDIKLGNILVEYNDEKDKENLNLYNAKFKISPSSLSKKNSSFPEIFDSLDYLPPSRLEQITKEQKLMNFSIDIWQCGILAFKILFNRHPFLSKKEEIVTDPITENKNESKYFFNKKKKTYTIKDKLKILYDNIKKGDYYIDLIKEYQCEVSKEVLVFFSQALKREQIVGDKESDTLSKPESEVSEHEHPNIRCFPEIPKPDNDPYNNLCQKFLKSKFFVRNVSKFTMIDNKNFTEQLPEEMIENDKIKLNINSEKELTDYEQFEEFK